MARTGDKAVVREVVTPKQILDARAVLNALYIDERVEQYIVDLVFATREPEAYGLGNLKDLIEFGASPRATIFLNKAAKAHAFLKHRGYVIPEDIKSVGMDILRHRVILSYEAEAEEMTSETIIEQLFERVEVP